MNVGLVGKKIDKVDMNLHKLCFPSGYVTTIVEKLKMAVDFI